MTNQENPWGDAEVSVTLKQHKGYESPWIVIRGASTEAVKAEVEKATGLSGEGLTLHEMVYNAAYSFQKISTVATGLDAVVIPEDSPQTSQDTSAAPEPTPAPAAAPAAEAPAEEPDHADVIGKMTAKSDITSYYLRNKAAFDSDKDLMAALQARFTAEDVS